MEFLKETKGVPSDLSEWDLSDFGLTWRDGWASLVFVRVFGQLKDDEVLQPCFPVGYVFIRDPKFGKRALWKMPGGHKMNEDKSPLYTAQRELYGETGVFLPLKCFRYICKRRGLRGDHWRCIFTADMSLSKDVPWMNSEHPENDGEKQKYFSIEDFCVSAWKGKFLMNHLNILNDESLIPPLSWSKD